VKPCRKFFSPTGPISPLQKKPVRPSGPEPLLDQLGVVIWAAEQLLAAPVATAQAPAIDRCARQLLFGPRQHRVHVFGRRFGRPALELGRLALARKRAHRDAS